MSNTGHVDGLAVTLVQASPGGDWEHRFMLVGDMLVCGHGAADEKARHYTVDHYPEGEARRLLLAYVGDHDTEGWQMVGGVANFTVTSYVYATIRHMDDHRGPSTLIHQLFHIARHGFDPPAA